MDHLYAESMLVIACRLASSETSASFGGSAELRARAHESKCLPCARFLTALRVAPSLAEIRVKMDTDLDARSAGSRIAGLVSDTSGSAHRSPP